MWSTSRTAEWFPLVTFDHTKTTQTQTEVPVIMIPKSCNNQFAIDKTFIILV